MNLRKNFDSAKEEFGSDEKMLESVFRLEALFKKYKWIVFSILALVIILPTAFWIKDYLTEQEALKTTALFNQYQETQDPQILQAIQKQNIQLYELITLSNALKNQDIHQLEDVQNVKNTFIASYAKYQISSLNKDFKTDDNLGDFNNLVLLQEGYLQVMQNNHAQAMQFLNQISPSSDLREWALRIGHYGITR